jgi:integrase
MTFRELFQKYEEHGNPKAYVSLYKDRMLSFFGDRRISSLTSEDIHQFKKSIQNTPRERGKTPVTNSTVNRALAALRVVFNWTLDQKPPYLTESPFPRKGLFFPERQGQRLSFTRFQMEKILELSPKWLKPLILTNVYTGLREGELFGLMWEYFDFEAGVFYLPQTKTLNDQTGKGQEVVMQRELISLLQSLPRKGKFVFCQPNGKPFKGWHVYKPFKRILKSLGIDTRYSFRNLRHTSASLLRELGVDPISIKRHLRHKDLRTTEAFYFSHDVDYQREQVERLSLKEGEACA